MSVVSIPPVRKREYLPKDYRLTIWSRLKPYFDELLKRPIDSIAALKQWMSDRNEIESFINEETNWRYLNFAKDSRDVDSKEAYNYAVQEIASKLGPINHQLDEKLLGIPFIEELPPDTFGVYLNKIKRNQQLFYEANEKLKAEVELHSRKYTEIFSGISIVVRAQELNIQQANALLEDNNRAIREEVFQKLTQEILKRKTILNDLFSDLLKSRHQMALNAGFKNFRDYQFSSLHRIDYGVKECTAFQEGVLQEIAPLIRRINRYRKKTLGFRQLRPWDVQIDIKNRVALKPFRTVKELINGTHETLKAISPYFADCFSVIEQMNHLDLSARKHKRPGGFLMFMPQSRVPFIFSNVTRSIKDVRTLLHESGHAIHSFLMKDIALFDLRRLPLEVAELAAMTLELLGMEHWETFFPKQEDRNQAKSWQLFKTLEILPWIAAIDRFQHWLYTHPEHTLEEREEKWDAIYQDFCLPEVDWSGFEDYRSVNWLNQLHMFEFPFYFIEYGFAQLGAISLWQQYQDNPEQQLLRFSEALKLGNTRTVTEIYKTAGIPFDWSANYLKQLAERILEELQEVLGEEL